MPDEIQPTALEQLRPDQFQRLALDLLRAQAAEQGLEVRALDLGYGRKDAGWDGRWIRRDGGMDWRIEVKATGNWSTLRAEVADHLRKYDDRPTLVVCRLPLSEHQRDELKNIREEPVLDVVDGSQIAGFLRDYDSIARVWGFGPAVELLTPEKFAEQHASRVPLQSEVDAAESALSAMAGSDTSMVLVDAAESSRPHAVLEEVARRVAEQGDPGHRAVFVAKGPDLRDHSDARLRSMFARPSPRRTRLILFDPDEGLVQRLVTIGLSVITGRRGGVRNLIKLGARSSLRTFVVALPKPPAADLRRLAQQVSGRDGIEIDDAALQWGDPDLLQTALQEPVDALESEFWARAGDSERRRLGAWIGLLGEATIEQLMSVTGMDRQAALRRVEDLQRAGLLQTRAGTILPEVPVSRPLLVRMWTEDDECDPVDLSRTIMALEAGERATALEGLFGASPLNGDSTAGKIAHEVLKAAAPGDRQAVLRMAPVVFAISESWYRWALEQATGLDLPRGTVLTLVEACRWRQSLAPEAMELLLSTNRHQVEGPDHERRVGEAFHPGALGAAAAARALERLAQRIETAPESCSGSVVKSVAQIWLAGDVQTERALPSGIEFGHATWNVESVSVRDAFAAATRVAVASATSSIRSLRDIGWDLLEAAGNGTAVDAPPSDLAAKSVNALIAAAAKLDQLGRVERLLRQEQLQRKTWQAWTHQLDLPARVLEALAEDVGSTLIRRLTTLYDLKKGVNGPARSWEDMEPIERDRLAERDEQAVSAWLATAPTVNDLFEVLRDAGELLAMPHGRHLLRGQVVEHLTRLRPDLVEAVLFGDRWDALSRDAKTTLLDAARVHYGDELAACVKSWSGWRPGLSAAIRRFLSSPRRSTSAEAWDITWLLRKVAPDDVAPAIIARLSSEADPSVRQLLEWWCLEVYERGQAQPAQVLQALAALFAPPNGLRTLGEFGMRLRRDRLPNAEPGSPIENLLLDGLEAQADFAAANPNHEGPRDLYLGEGIVPLVDRLIGRPATWWKVAVQLPRVSHHRDEKLFAHLGEAEKLRILLAGPSDQQPPITVARILDAGIGSLRLETFASAVASLVDTGELQRAAAWFISRGLDTATIDTFIALVSQLDAGDIEHFARRVGSACGLTGFGAARTFASRPFDEPETLEPPPIVGVLREKAREETLHARVRGALVLVADCIAEDTDVQNLILRKAWDD